MSDTIQQLLLQLVLIMLNAFFAATEIAVISLNEKKVKNMAEDGDKKAAKMLKMIEDPTRFLSTIQIGITLAGFLGSAFAADNFAEKLSAFAVTTLGISPEQAGLVNTASVVIITLILSFFTLVLGELVPKRIAMRHKEKLANAVCGFISGIATVLKPIIWLLTVSTNGVLRLFGIDPKAEEESVSEEDIVLMLDAGAEEGTLDPEGIQYIKNVFKLDRLCAADVMTPKKSLVTVYEDAADEEIVAMIAEHGYSRVPVYSQRDDDTVVGVLHARDYLLKHNNENFRMEDAMFEASFVPESMHLDDLFSEMQKEHNHIVVVVNEFGVPSGVVTMEDILEEIVGEIWDEQDEEVESILAQEDGSFLVLPQSSLEELFAFFEVEPDEESEASTVNGWIMEKCGNIPDSGFSFSYGSLTLYVLEADDLQARKVSVTVSESKTGEKTEE